MQVLDKAAQFKASVHREVDGMLKSIGNIQATYQGFKGYAWTAVKNPAVLLLPTFAQKHEKAFKQMVDTCAYYYGHNHFFNMCIRMAEIAAIKAGAEHLQVTAKRQAMMGGFARVQKSILFEDNIRNQWDDVTKAVAKKLPGFEDHLVGMTEMMDACHALGVLINDSFTTLTAKQGITDLVEDMVKYHDQINDEAAEAIMA